MIVSHRDVSGRIYNMHILYLWSILKYALACTSVFTPHWINLVGFLCIFAYAVKLIFLFILAIHWYLKLNCKYNKYNGYLPDKHLLPSSSHSVLWNIPVVTWGHSPSCIPPQLPVQPQPAHWWEELEMELRQCWAGAGRLVCYQCCFSHKPKTQHHTGCCPSWAEPTQGLRSSFLLGA